MNLCSMTGFALARQDHAAGTIVFEIRSVNSRFLDAQFRISEELRAGESILREAITARVSRGKLDCRFYIHRAGQSAPSLRLNAGLVGELGKLERDVLAVLPQAGALRVSEVLHWPGVLEDSALSEKEVLELAANLGAEALDQLTQTRDREGAKLGQMINERVDKMEAIAHRLVPLIPELVSLHQQRLVERLSAALGISLEHAAQGKAAAALTREEALDRIRQEATVFGVRIDVSEELSRLEAHLSETRRILAAGGACGKRLDFMMQELNREANTLGSKSAAAELSDAAMALKLLIEQMREQVQNLE